MALLNSVSSIVVIADTENKIKLINKSGVELQNRSRNKLLNKDWIETILLGGNKTRMRKEVDTLLNGTRNSFTNIPCSLLSQDGIQYTASVSGQRIQNEQLNTIGLVITIENVLSDVANSGTLKKQADPYLDIVGNIPDITMYLFDHDLRFILAEGKEMQTQGLSKEQVLGRTVYEIYDTETCNEIASAYKQALSGKQQYTGVTIKNSVYVIRTYPAYSNDGSIYAGVAVHLNITKDKEIETRLRKEKKTAEEESKTKSEFLANVSHEIRTPLNAIIGFSEQLLKTDLSEKQENFVKIIDKSSEHLLSLVNDVLILSKIEAGRISFDLTPFKIESLLEEVYNVLKIKASSKNIAFSYTVEPQLNQIIVGDQFILRQVLMNLLNNAIKFTSSGYVELRCFLKKEQQGKLFIRFDVIDTGVGIASNKLKTIFDEFKQADSTITKRYGGTGLGLTISKRLVEMQNGEIKINSELDVGTQVTVTIPYKKGSSSDFVQEKDEPTEIQPLNNLNVLLVDDDAVNRLLGKTILENLKCNIDIAFDGEEAITKYKQNRYDVILLDIHMPDISGLEVARHIRQKSKDNKTKIIAVTAAVLKNSTQDYFNAGINDYLIKPFKEINIYNKICHVLGISNIPYNPTKAEKIIIEESDAQFYNLEDLQHMSGGNTEFVKKALRSFKDNARQDLSMLNDAMKKENWTQVGEIAHKMLPSFRHLKIHPIIPLLEHLKKKTLIEPDDEPLNSTVMDVTILFEQVIGQLNKDKAFND
jgi:signal transduction histidine kinase/CheY-like chemotaxis protein